MQSDSESEELCDDHFLMWQTARQEASAALMMSKVEVFTLDSNDALKTYMNDFGYQSSSTNRIILDINFVVHTSLNKNNTANKLVLSVNARKKDTREEFPEDIFFQIYCVHNLSL